MEYLDIVDRDGNKTGKSASRDEVHRKGSWHKAVHIWFVNSKNEILLQLRSQNKESYPGFWDISVAGHLSSGDSDIDGAIRETKEEIGLTLEGKDFEFIGNAIDQSEPKPGYINNEVNPVFIVRKDLDISSLTIQKEEVDALKYVPMAEFKRMVENKDSKLVMFDEEFELLFKYLDRK